jgi:transcription elongation factor SPT5
MLRASASRFRRDREQEERPEDLSAIAEDYAKRYKQSAPTRYTGDMNDVPQRLLMPSVHDANLWQVRVKVSSRLVLHHFA